jgi:hypothetical protein
MMAKLSARTANEVAKIATAPADGSHRALMALRSDGKVLRRLASVSGGSRGGTAYKIIGSVPPDVLAGLRTGPLTWDHDLVRAYLGRVAARNYREHVTS